MMVTLRIFFARLTPAWVSKAVYASCFYVIRFLFPSSGGRFSLWYRHGLVTHTPLFLLSDLDLTLFLSDEALLAEVPDQLSFLAKLKKIFKIIGEVNFYCANDLPFFSEVINRYELERDPELQKRIGPRSLSPTELKGQKIAFLMRNLSSDFGRLQNIASLREQKWRSHFQAIGSPLLTADFSLSVVINQLADLFEYQNGQRGEFETQLLLLLENRTQLESGQGLQYAHLRWAWILFPQACAFYQLTPSKMSELEMAVMQAQLEWEIQGLFTQNLNFLSNPVLLNHLQGILDFVEKDDFFRDMTLLKRKLSEGLQRMNNQRTKVFSSTKTASIL